MDEDGFGCIVSIIVVTIGVYVGIWLLGIFVGLLVATLPAWGAGAISGTATYGLARVKIASDLRSPKKLSKLVTLRFDGNSLAGEPNQEAMKSYAFMFNLASIATCFLVTAIIFNVVISRGSLATQDDWMRNLGLLLTAGMTIGMSVVLATQLNLASAVETETTGALRRANISLRSSEELQEIVRENALIAEELEIAFPQAYFDEVRGFVESHKVDVLADPSSLDAVIAAALKEAKQDGVHLTSAVERFNQAMALHRRTSQAVFATGSASMLSAVDLIYSQLHEAKEACLPQHEWDTFDEAIAVYSGELHQLEQQAISVVSGKDPAEHGTDAYVTLGVTPDMSDTEIKIVYRDLCHIYHPDKGKVRDSNKFLRIQEAYAAIMAGRKS